ncbi:MAG: hypothetical protein ACRCX8_13060 [Sarcina sp.]
MKVIFRIILLSCFFISSFVIIFCDIKIFKMNKIYSETSVDGYKKNQVLYPEMMKRDEVKKYALDFFNIKDEAATSEIHITVRGQNERGLWSIVISINEKNVYYFNIFADNKECQYMEIYREDRKFFQNNTERIYLNSEKEKESEKENIEKIKAMIERINIDLDVDNARIGVSEAGYKIKEFAINNEKRSYLFFIDEEYDEIFLVTDEESYSGI